MDVVQIFHKEQKGAIDIINTGSNLIKYLSGRDSLCPFLSGNCKIKYVKKLGEGAQGVVYEIDFPHKGSKQYVVKKSIEERYHKCNRKKFYERFDGEGITKISPRSIICDVQYSEYAISLLVGELFRREICINFVDVFAFAVCTDQDAKHKTYNYTFMEKANSTLRKKGNCIFGSSKNKTTLTNVLLIQILFAMAVYQKEYEIVHGDLHGDNIFLFYGENIKWKGKKITKVDYFEYNIAGRAIYMPAIPIIAKIGDFGFAVKYSKNMIGNSYVLETGYDQKDGRGPIVPNFYTKAYDLIYLVDEFRESNPSNEFIKSICAYIAGLDSNCTDKKLNDKFKKLTDSKRRPRVKGIMNLTHATPEAILTNAQIMGKFFEKPKGVILNIGTV